MHRVHQAEGDGPRARLLASGVSVPWALEAAELLDHHWGVKTDVWSVTAWGELRKEGLAYEDKLFLEPGAEAELPYVTQRLQESSGPVVAVTDYNHSVPDMIRQWVPEEYATLGADSYGFSDTRPAARRHFKIDGPSAVVKVLQLLRSEEHTSELQSRGHLVCRLPLENKK